MAGEHCGTVCAHCGRCDAAFEADVEQGPCCDYCGSANCQGDCQDYYDAMDSWAEEEA